MGCNESSPNREIYSNKLSHQVNGASTNKQPDAAAQAPRKGRTSQTQSS